MAAPLARRAPAARASPALGPAAARIAPFALFIALLAAQPLLEAHLDARWLVALRGVAVAAVLALFWRSYTELHAAPPVRAREGLLAAAVGFAVFLAWIAFDSGWAAFGDGARGFAPLDAAGRLDPALVALRLAGLALVVPVMEELFWRSFLLRWIDRKEFLALDPRRSSPVAFALSCALFASEHAQWLAGLLAGLGYGWLYVRTANVKVSILSHAITNGTLGLWILATHRWDLW